MALLDLMRTALEAAGRPAPRGEPELRRALQMIRSPLGVRMPQGFDDADDLDVTVALLTASERSALGLGPTRARSRRQTPTSGTMPKPYKIRFHVILCANDDGSGAHATLDAMADFYEKVVPEVNAVFASTAFEFVFDRRRDIELLNSTLLNQDFVPPPGLNLNAPSSDPPLSEEEIKALSKPHEDARDALAGRYKGRLVHFCVDGTSLWYRDEPGKPKQWVITPRYGGYSSETQEYVHVTSWVSADITGHASFLAHEIGHYLHLPHTFRDEVGGVVMKLTAEERAALTEAQQLDELKKRQAKAIANYISAGHPAVDGLCVFDGDGLEGSPPDDGGAAIQLLNGGNSCGPIGSMEIHVEGQSEPYVLEPDRGNVMSYFKGCTNFQQHFSADQGDVSRIAVETKNRRHLITPHRGTPAVASRKTGVADLFGLGQNRAVWHRGVSAVSDSPWKNLGGAFAGDPAAVSWGPDRLDVFCVAESGRMMHKAWTPSSSWYPSAAEWEDLGGVFHRVLNRPPAVVSRGLERLDVFGIGMDGGAWHRAWTGSGWYPENEWEPLGGTFCSSLAVAAPGPSWLDLFGVGMDGGIWHRAWNGSTWSPKNEWKPLGGSFTTCPAVCSGAKGRLHVFAVGEDGGMYHKTRTGSVWGPSTGWKPLGGTFSSPPAACSWGPDRADVFGLGMNKAMYHRAWKDGVWHPKNSWEKLGGVFTSRPAAFAFADPDVLQVAGLGQDGALYRKGGFPDGWSPEGTGWHREGGVFV